MWHYNLTDDDIKELVVRCQWNTNGDSVADLDKAVSRVRLWLRRLDGSKYIENEPVPCTNDDHFIYGRHEKDLHDYKEATISSGSG